MYSVVLEVRTTVRTKSTYYATNYESKWLARVEITPKVLVVN